MAKSTAEKLGIKPGSTLRMINASDGQVALLGTLPDGVTMVDSDSGAGADGDVGTTADVVLLFAHDSSELHKYAPSALKAGGSDGKVWIAYRKGNVSDLGRDTLMPALVDQGWHGVSLISIDSTWSAARFRPLDQIGR